MPAGCSVVTLGCKVNQYETEEMLRQLEMQGYGPLVPSGEGPAVCVVNTCAVTAEAEKKSRQAIRRMLRENPEALVIVTGCLAQRAPEETASMSDRVTVIGNADKADIVSLLSTGPGCRVSPLDGLDYRGAGIDRWHGRVRGIVKAQDGCHMRCAYCLVPLVRGPLRSRPAADIYAEIMRLAEGGMAEVVLTGIHLGMYGERPGDGLADLLFGLPEHDKLKRIRLSSIEPTDFTPKLIAAIKSDDRVCKHLHIPLQHGCDAVLQRMGRPYDAVGYLRLLERLRGALPGLAVTTDVMAGFPGETDEEFDRSLATLREAAFSGLHAFRYSPRPLTAAADMPLQVPVEKKSARMKALAAYAARFEETYALSLIGSRLVVIIEEFPEEGIAAGRSDRYIPALFSVRKGKSDGDAVEITVTGWKEGRLVGKEI